jgi:preprotein translocase subunit SecY
MRRSEFGVALFCHVGILSRVLLGASRSFQSCLVGRVIRVSLFCLLPLFHRRLRTNISFIFITIVVVVTIVVIIIVIVVYFAI